MKQLYKYDIGVLDPDTGSPSLIVEIKSKLPSDMNLWKERMAQYMVDVSCHYGLLVTPEKVFLLRDNFQTMDEDSIKIVAEIHTEKVLGQSNFENEKDLETAVKNWLDDLTKDWHSALPSNPEIVELLVPDFIGAVSGGNVVYEFTPETA